LMVTHVLAFYLLARPQPRAAQAPLHVAAS
jgi:hypothetical protein